MIAGNVGVRVLSTAAKIAFDLHQKEGAFPVCFYGWWKLTLIFILIEIGMIFLFIQVMPAVLYVSFILTSYLVYRLQSLQACFTHLLWQFNLNIDYFCQSLQAYVVRLRWFSLNITILSAHEYASQSGSFPVT